MAARALRDRLGLEPDVDRAAPVAQAARRPQGRRPARRGRSVPQPHRARGRRAPAPAAGHRRRARDRDDARDRRRRPAGRGLVPRARRGLRRAAGALGDTRSSAAAEICGVDAETIARIGREFASTRPALLRLGVGAQRHLGAPAAYSTLASLPALTGAWRDRGGGCSYIPTATAAAVSDVPLQREDLRPGPVRTINMSQVGERAHRSGAGPAGQGARVLELEPGRDRARPGAGARRPAPRGPVHGRARAVHDRHRRARRRGAAGHHPARAPRRGLLLGPSLPDLERARDRAARRGQAEHRGLPAARRAPRPRRSLLRRHRRSSSSTPLLAGFEENGLRERGWTKVDLGQGPVPARRRRLRHRERQGDAAAPTTCRRRRWPTPRSPSASRSR